MMFGALVRKDEGNFFAKMLPERGKYGILVAVKR